MRVRLKNKYHIEIVSKRNKEVNACIGVRYKGENRMVCCVSFDCMSIETLVVETTTTDKGRGMIHL